MVNIEVGMSTWWPFLPFPKFKRTCSVTKRTPSYLDMFYTGVERLWSAANVNKWLSSLFFLLYWQFANQRGVYCLLLYWTVNYIYKCAQAQNDITTVEANQLGRGERGVGSKQLCLMWGLMWQPQKAYYMTDTSQVNHWIHPEVGQCHKLLSQAPKETAKHLCLSSVPSKANFNLLEHHGIPVEKDAMTRSNTRCPLYQYEESLLSQRPLLIDHRGFLEICYHKDRSNLLWFSPEIYVI